MEKLILRERQDEIIGEGKVRRADHKGHKSAQKKVNGERPQANVNGEPFGSPFEIRIASNRLERLYVLSLPALGSLHDVELNRLTFLKAAESVRLDRREMHENVFAILAADESKTFSVVEPLYSSLFHFAVCSFVLMLVLE